MQFSDTRKKFTILKTKENRHINCIKKWGNIPDDELNRNHDQLQLIYIHTIIKT